MSSSHLNIWENIYSRSELTQECFSPIFAITVQSNFFAAGRIISQHCFAEVVNKDIYFYLLYNNALCDSNFISPHFGYNSAYQKFIMAWILKITGGIVSMKWCFPASLLSLQPHMHRKNHSCRWGTLRNSMGCDMWGYGGREGSMEIGDTPFASRIANHLCKKHFGRKVNSYLGNREPKFPAWRISFLLLLSYCSHHVCCQLIEIGKLKI